MSLYKEWNAGLSMVLLRRFMPEFSAVLDTDQYCGEFSPLKVFLEYAIKGGFAARALRSFEMNLFDAKAIAVYKMLSTV